MVPKVVAEWPGVVDMAADLVDAVGQHAEVAELALVAHADRGLVHELRPVQAPGPDDSVGHPEVAKPLQDPVPVPELMFES